MPSPSKLQQADPPAGLDDEHTDAAVVHGHPKPPSRVALQCSACAISDNISMTHQDIDRGAVLTWLSSVEIFPEGSLYPRSFLEEICRVRGPALNRRIWNTRCPLPKKVTVCVLNLRKLFEDNVGSLCGSGHGGLHQPNIGVLHLVPIFIQFLEILRVEHP